MNRRQTAVAILETGLLTEVIEEWQQQQFQTFISTQDAAVWAKARAGAELRGFIENKCSELARAESE